MIKIAVDNLKSGMVLAKSVVNDVGMMLFNKGTCLTQTHIDRLINMGINHVFIEGSDDRKEPIEKIIDDIENRFQFVSNIPIMVIVKKNLLKYVRDAYKNDEHRPAEV